MCISLIFIPTCLNEPINLKNVSAQELTDLSHVIRPQQAAKFCASVVVLAVRVLQFDYTVFPRRERLPRAAFSRVSRTGQRLSSTHFIAILSNEVTGYAVVVPKKVARLSVTRHRIKRQIFGALQTLTLPKSLILLPKASVSQLGYTHIKAEISSLLSKIH